MVTNKDLHHRFSHHPPTDESIEKHSTVREECLLLAYSLNELLPEGREKSTALTKLEEVMMHANAAIARNQGKPKLPEPKPVAAQSKLF